MKKLFILLLIISLSIFTFTGCDGVVPGEGEGEGEGETEGVTVDIEGSTVFDGKMYVGDGWHDITVTFPTPADGNVKVTVTNCSGDYRASNNSIIVPPEDQQIIMFPNEDRTIWTGSAEFGICYEGNFTAGRDFQQTCIPCCASYVKVTSGECENEVCINIPVIVDGGDPYALFELKTNYCECGGCAVEFYISKQGDECSTTECCGDDCTELSTGSIAIYDEDPFDKCCNIPCAEPVWACSFDCPEDVSEPVCVTDCLDPQEIDGEWIEGMLRHYYIVIDLADVLGNKTRYYAAFGLSQDTVEEKCEISLKEYYADNVGNNDCDCTDWIYSPYGDGGGDSWQHSWIVDHVLLGSCIDFELCCPNCGCYEDPLSDYESPPAG